MMRSLFAGMAGIKTHQTKMDVIGNNISNVNTTAFKSGRATFSEMLSQNIKGASAATNPMQVGLGSSVGAIDLIYKNGTPLTTGKNTDLCLSGDGMFMVKRGNETFYTRNGAFEFDASGNYVLPGTGHIVQGWMAQEGVITPGSTVQNIKLNKSEELKAKQTDMVNYYDNLNANVPVVTQISGGENGTASATNPLTLTLSDGTTVVKTEGTYKTGNSLPIATSVKIYDSLGGTHDIPVYYIREGTLNENGSVSYSGKWLVSMTPDSSVASGQTTTSKFIDASGNEITASMNAVELQFNAYGKLGTGTEEGSGESTETEESSAAAAETEESSAESAEAGGGLTAAITISYAATASETGDSASESGSESEESGTTDTATDTADEGSESGSSESTVPAAQNLTVDFSGVTQYAYSTTITSNSNGYTKGYLSQIEIDSSGTITGIYTNGLRRPEAQVAVARFANPTGLLKTNSSFYTTSNNTGQVQIDTASKLGNIITPGALEMSNVDIANEFAEMIITQRGFQSNSKVITVGDELIETAVNMKR